MLFWIVELPLLLLIPITSRPKTFLHGNFHIQSPFTMQMVLQTPLHPSEKSWTYVYALVIISSRLPSRSSRLVPIMCSSDTIGSDAIIPRSIGSNQLCPSPTVLTLVIYSLHSARMKTSMMPQTTSILPYLLMSHSRMTNACYSSTSTESTLIVLLSLRSLLLKPKRLLKMNPGPRPFRNIIIPIIEYSRKMDLTSYRLIVPGIMRSS